MVVNFLGGLQVLVCRCGIRCVFLCHVPSLSFLLVAEDERSESREVWVFGLPRARSVRERVLTKHNTSRADGGDCCISRPTGTLPLICSGSSETTVDTGGAGICPFACHKLMYSHF